MLLLLPLREVWSHPCSGESDPLFGTGTRAHSTNAVPFFFVSQQRLLPLHEEAEGVLFTGSFGRVPFPG